MLFSLRYKQPPYGIGTTDFFKHRSTDGPAQHATHAPHKAITPKSRLCVAVTPNPKPAYEHVFTRSYLVTPE